MSAGESSVQKSLDYYNNIDLTKYGSNTWRNELINLSEEQSQKEVKTQYGVLTRGDILSKLADAKDDYYSGRISHKQYETLTKSYAQINPSTGLRLATEIFFTRIAPAIAAAIATAGIANALSAPTLTVNAGNSGLTLSSGGLTTAGTAAGAGGAGAITTGAGAATLGESLLLGSAPVIAGGGMIPAAVAGGAGAITAATGPGILNSVGTWLGRAKDAYDVADTAKDIYGVATGNNEASDISNLNAIEQQQADQDAIARNQNRQVTGVSVGGRQTQLTYPDGTPVFTGGRLNRRPNLFSGLLNNGGP